MSTLYLGNESNIFNVPLGEISVHGEGGEDKLIVDYSEAGGPVIYWDYGWRYISDEAMNTVEFYDFEIFDITGGADSDDLRGGNLADRLIGGGGNDTLHSGLGADVIDGGEGNKDKWVVDYTGLAPENITIQLLGGGNISTIQATGAQVSSIESLTVDTGSGDDVIDTSLVIGNDDIETREGDDIVNPGLGFDRVDLGYGNDTLILNYSATTADIQHLNNYGWFRYQDGFAPTTAIDYYYYNVEQFNITGGSGNDVLSGRSDHDGNDRLVGNAGNDMLYGYGGIDTIEGGAGIDTWIVNYDEVNDAVQVNINTTTQTASTGATISGIEQLVIDTHQGDDVITAKSGKFNDVIRTNGGADTINPGRGQDSVNAGNYGEGNILILNWSAAATAVAWSESWGWNTFTSGEGDRVEVYGIDSYNISTGKGNDTLRTFGGADTLNGGAGSDWLNSGSGKATIDGGAGIDYWEADVSSILTGLVVNATTSQTKAQGTAAGHSIRNVEGFRLTTGNGNDSINSQGYATHDIVNTGGGNDTVALGLGFDVADGGYGDTDTLIVDYSTLTSSINRADDYGWMIYSDALKTAQIRYYSFEKFDLTGGSGGDHLYGADNADRLIGNAGDDILSGFAGKDTINGGDGNDSWVGRYQSLTGKVALTLPSSGTAAMQVSGADYTSLTSIENIDLTTGAGADVINLLGRTGKHTIETNDGNDTVKLASGTHKVNGGGGNDLLVLDFSSSTSAIRQIYHGETGFYLYYDTGEMNSALHYGFDQFDITGGSGNDRLWAWEGDDKLNGGNGNDVLTGKGGSDILTGGLGNDIFVFDSYNNGVDTITDASAGDIIRVNGRSFSGTVTSADGSAVMTDQVQLAVDTVNNKSTLFIGSDGTPGADVIITLEGIYTTEAFTLVGKDIKVTQGTTNTPGVGDDTVNGTAGNDDLSGGDGHDKLLGKAGNDVLMGDAGNDTLIGGLGADTLIGGAGNDIFQFSTLRDSTPGTLNHDVIEDFTSGADKLDLSPIDANPVLTGNQAFKFIATDFTGEAGQVRYVDGLLLADVNGDGMTDIEILLLGTPALVAGDLIL